MPLRTLASHVAPLKPRIRALARRVAQPIVGRYTTALQAQSDHLAALDARLRAIEQHQAALADQLADQAELLHSTTAFGWDYVAMVRRLGEIEDALGRVDAALHASATPARSGVPRPHFLHASAHEHATESPQTD